MNSPASYEDRRATFRAGVGPERQLAVVRKGRREFTVWIRDVSSGGIAFRSESATAFRAEDKIVVVTSSGTFEGRVAHVTPMQAGGHVVGVQRLRILEELHAQILERGDLPRTPAWLGSFACWAGASVAICATFFYLESAGHLEPFGLRAHAASVDFASHAPVDIRGLAESYRPIESLLDAGARQRIGLSQRQERHVVAIAEQTAIRLASILAEPPGPDQDESLREGALAIADAQRRIAELLDPDQRDRWRAATTLVAGKP